MLLRGAFIALVAAVIIGVTPQLFDQTANADDHPMQVTVRNMLSDQSLTPALVIVHDADAVILPSSAERLEGLEELAESGSNAALIETLNDRDGVKSVFRFGGLIGPYAGASIQNVEADIGDYITIIGMLTCTNDGIAVGTVIVPAEEDLPVIGSGRVLDAGTEENTESEADVPCLGGQGVSDLEGRDGEGEITPHPGIAGTGDLDADLHGWTGAAIQITVSQRGSTVLSLAETNINVQNLTQAQPLTAPLVVVHDPTTNPFDYTRPSELPGIADFAEGGLALTLIPTLLEIPGVVDVAQVEGPGRGGVILGGTGISIPITVIDGAHISVAGMFACTNDAYVVARVPVRIVGGEVQLERAIGEVFDAGSENNDETTATVPCLGEVAAALSAGDGEGSRSAHPGITGDADLSANMYAWHPSGTIAVSVAGTPLPPQPLPSVGGWSPTALSLLFAGIAGLALLMLGAPAISRALRGNSTKS